jgi:hypothetical protein
MGKRRKEERRKRGRRKDEKERKTSAPRVYPVSAPYNHGVSKVLTFFVATSQVSTSKDSADTSTVFAQQNGTQHLLVC